LKHSSIHFDIYQPDPVSPEAQIHLHVDDVPVSPNENNQKPVNNAGGGGDDDNENIDELNGSLQDLIIEYRLQEQQKAIENGESSVEDDDDVNLQRILKQIGVSLHNKYREKTNSDQTKSKLSTMIQQLYQTLKKTQPELFTKTLQTDDQSSTTTDTNTSEEIYEEENEIEGEEVEEEEVVVLTPEMERANTFFDQANRLINVTLNRQYDA
jgi:rRNA maturation endonuclease Nob1